LPDVALAPRRVRAVLLWAVAAFTVLTAAAQVARELWPGSVTANALYFFDASVEATIPTLFSTLLLVACAVLLVSRWPLLAAVVALLALDETAGFHEATVRPLRRLLDADGVLYYTWVIPGALFAVALIPLFRPLVADLNQRQRRLLVVAAVTFFGSALGLELVEGWLANEHGDTDARLIPVSTAQEALEMTGAVLFLYVLMDRLAPWRAALRIG
jgi:hypothetical protein